MENLFLPFCLAASCGLVWGGWWVLDQIAYHERREALTRYRMRRRRVRSLRAIRERQKAKRCMCGHDEG